MKATGTPPTGRFQRRLSLGTSIARAMISMSPDVTFDRTSEQSTSLSIKLCQSSESYLSGTSCFSPSTAISNISGTSSTTLHSMTDRTTASSCNDTEPTPFGVFEIPNELNSIFNRLDAWQEPHGEQNIIETSRSTNVIPSEQHLFPLNNNSGTSSFMKYIQENTSLGMKWDRLLSPIKEPFTKGMHDQQQIQLALTLFKLVLRFINSSEHDHKRERALGDYVVQMGLMNELLRDEIIVQIINQIWNNIDSIKLNKAWLLMFNCLGCFPPSPKFYKYLLKFVSEENPSTNELGKRKLLAANSTDAARTYPPTQLEWCANQRSMPMALQAEFFDGFKTLGEVESWTTGEQFAYELVSSRGILKDYSFGWTITLDENDDEIELMGHDYLLDLIGELEIPPCSPVCKSYFLIHDGRDRASKSHRRRNHRTAVRSKEWFLKVDNARASRLSKASRRISSSNRSSPYKYPKHISSDDQQYSGKKYIKHHSPLYHDVASKKSNSCTSLSESFDEPESFPLPPPPTQSVSKDILKVDETSVYSMTDGPEDEQQQQERTEQEHEQEKPREIHHEEDTILARKNEINMSVRQNTPPLPPFPSSTRSTKEKPKIENEIKTVEKRVQLHHQPSLKKPNAKPSSSSNAERKGSIRKTSTFTSSSHSMVDAGCGGHILSKIPALRCFRPHKQHHSQKSRKTTQLPPPPPPMAVSNYNGAGHPTSFYGEGSGGSDGPTNLNQYEKIGSSIHNLTKPHGHHDEYHLSSVYSEGDANGDGQGDLTEYEAEDLQLKKTSSSKDINKTGTKFIKNKVVRPKTGYPQAKKQGATIFDSESIATITDLPLPCHKSDVEAFLDDLFDRALDPKNLAKKKAATKMLSTWDQHRLQMISNSNIDPAAGRRGLSNLLNKHQVQKKSSIHLPSIKDPNGAKKKKKNDKKDVSEAKTSIKEKKKYNHQLNTNNNNNNDGSMYDQSVSSFTSENQFTLPQVGYPSRMNVDDNNKCRKHFVRPKHRILHRQASGSHSQGYDRIRQLSTNKLNEQTNRFLNSCYPQPAQDKKNIKLIPINPAVCFATTTSTSPNKKPSPLTPPSNSNGPVFVPVINISGKKYLPVYLKQSANDTNKTDEIKPPKPMAYRTDVYVSPIISSNATNVSKKTPTIMEENEAEAQTTSIQPAKTNVCVGRLSRSQLDLASSRNDQAQKHTPSKDNSLPNINRTPVRLSSNIFTRRSPESHKNLRAKTVRIGKIRWPPPLNPEDDDNANEQRRMLVQRRIQEEIHGNKIVLREVPPIITTAATIIADINKESTSVLPDKVQPSQCLSHVKILTVEPKPPNGRRSLSIEKNPASSGNDQTKKSPIRNTSHDRVSTISNDEDTSTNEIVARNQSSKLDFHKTMTPMIGKENFELRKKLFEHTDESSFADPVPVFTDLINTSKSSSQQVTNYLTYHNIPWKLKIRKEIFSPIEKFDQPLLIDLLYLQIVHDTFSTICVRINEAERTNMKTFLSSHGVGVIDDIDVINKLSVKKTIIDQARQWPTYFCRFFPVSIPKYHSDEVQMLGISHSAVLLLKRCQSKSTNDTLQVLETFPFDTIQQISPIRNGSTIDLRLKKNRITIHSHRIKKITQLMDKFLKEFRTYKSKQRHISANKNHHEKFPSNLITNTNDVLKSSSQGSFVSCSQTFSELLPSASFGIQTPKPTQNEIMYPNMSTLPGGYSMMEFALKNFQIVNKKKQTKKSWKNSDWTWQDYNELIKWSKHPIQGALLRHLSNETSHTARQCFLVIMRFMGDYPMSRGQTELDCVFYLLKNIYKHRPLIDEVVCQVIKQVTENKSTKAESVKSGWKLMSILLNYFIPSENLRPYFLKYLNDHKAQHERLVQLCLNHYEQTLKYGGRKNTPSKAELDLLITTGRSGEKRQIFLLPGGTPLTLVTTPSMVISDCLHTLCERLNITNSLENDEYSIFIISSTENSSRLLNPNEYLFDILSECVRSNAVDFHLIVKRMLWFTVPMIFDDQNKSEVFIDFMFHQLVPELLEGTMIVIKNNQLSDEIMQEISLMAALQYRAANKIGLPSMREVKHLLPNTVLKLKHVRPQVWTTTVHEKLYSSVESMTPLQAQIKFINIIQTWPLFGTTFFAVQSVDNTSIPAPCLIGIYKHGILFLNTDTRDTLFSIPYNDVVSIRRHQHVIDIKYGSLNQPHVLQCKVERGQDLVALAGRYLSFIGRSLTSALERHSDSQQCHRPLTSTYNDPISTIL